MCGKVIASIVSIRVIGSNCEEVANRRVVTNLFAVDLSSVRVCALESLPNNWIELDEEEILA